MPMFYQPVNTGYSLSIESISGGLSINHTTLKEIRSISSYFAQTCLPSLPCYVLSTREYRVYSIHNEHQRKLPILHNSPYFIGTSGILLNSETMIPQGRTGSNTLLEPTCHPYLGPAGCSFVYMILVQPDDSRSYLRPTG